MTRPLRILYIVPQMDLGGAETHVVRLAEQLRRRGHDVQILCIFQEGILAAWIQKLGIPLAALHQKKWGFSAFRAVYERLKAQPVDVVHTYLFGLHLFGGVPARLAGVPVVVSSRRDVELSQPSKILWLEQAGNYFSDRVVCCSEAVRRWVLSRENLKSEKALTIYNGVDLSEFSLAMDTAAVRREFNIPETVPLVGTVANFSLKKGYGYFLETIRLILEQKPECYFLLVGSGPLEKAMRLEAAKLPRPSQIIFTGARRDIARLVSAMNVFAFCSLWEGLPNVVLEAMAMSRPVVSTPAGGVPEVITDGVNGRIVAMRAPEAMAQAILALIENPDRAQALGVAAQRTIETRFSLERMTDDYESFYRAEVH